MKNNEEYCLM